MAKSTTVSKSQERRIAGYVATMPANGNLLAYAAAWGVSMKYARTILRLLDHRVFVRATADGWEAKK